MTSEATDTALQRLLTDLDSADSLYQPTQFWRVSFKRLADELRGGGIGRFRALPGPLSFFVPTYGFPGYRFEPRRFDEVRRGLEGMQLSDRRCLAHLERLFSGESQAESDYRVLLASDTPGAPFLDRFSESTVGDPIEQFEFGGRRFSRSSLNYLLGLAFLKRHVDTSTIRTVLEIGGGFGTLGEILLGDPRNRYFYIDVDIPPAVYCATHYLSRIRGASAVLDYEATREVAELDVGSMAATHEAATLASWQLPRLTGRVDLFVNFISFQEMEPQVVRNYLAQVERLGARFLLLRNLREGKAKATNAQDVGVVDPVRGEDYDGFLPGFSLVATNTEPFGYRTVDGFHSELRLYQRN